MDDLQVIERISAGDSRAFEQLVRHYQRPLFHYLGRMGLSAGETEELAQETFLRAFQHLHKFEPERALFSTWLFTIARRLALNLLDRHRHAQKFALQREVETAGPAPHDSYDQAQIRRRIDAGLRQLPLKYRSPLALAYLEEMSITEIARIEGCAEGTVKSRIHRAKLQLKTLLADLLGDNDHA
ncbi:MAG: sigma-70 family RNA polymerase sigma factor [Chromatiales bacterium]|jgi:RNA polymerase sigma-70 factor (ECF subfamily)